MHGCKGVTLETRHMSHGTRHTSNDTRQTKHVTRHVTRHLPMRSGDNALNMMGDDGAAAAAATAAEGVKQSAVT